VDVMYGSGDTRSPASRAYHMGTTTSSLRLHFHRNDIAALLTPQKMPFLAFNFGYLGATHVPRASYKVPWYTHVSPNAVSYFLL